VGNLRYWVRGAPDGLPIPPMRMMWLVVGSTDISAFFETGHVQFHQLILPLLERNRLSLQGSRSVLDFGCGCGRIMRYWRSFPGLELWGVDPNSKMIDWCRRHLTFARFRPDGPWPPLGFASEKFDFIYARSVFTHLSEAAQSAWLPELRRVLKPGGILLFTVSGDVFRPQLTPEELRRYEQARLVVRQEERSGQNACAVFHPPTYVRQQWANAGFEIIDTVPGGQIPLALQDTYLVRRP
jgi:SAM-dependent methyltransferase